MAWTSFPSPPLAVDVEQKPRQVTLRLRGDLDFGSVPTLVSAARVATRGVTEVRLDLTQLDFCDVAGLRALDRLCARHEAAGRTVVVIGARPFLRRIATISGLLSQSLEEHQHQDR